MSGSRAATAGRVGLVAVLTAAAVALGFGETRAARTPAGDSPRASTPAVAALATAPPSSAAARPVAVPAAAAVQAALADALRARGLGGRVRADVVDATTGATLLADGATAPAAPASTAKLLTAAAALSTLGAGHTFTTSVRQASDGTLVLVGGGDPTLSAAPAGHDPAYPGAARLSELAADVRRGGVPVTRIVVDDARFAAPAVSPDWAAEDVPSDYGAAITAVMADGGRATPSAPIRSAQPDLAAGHELAALLGHAGLPVARGGLPAGTTVRGSVASAPVATLVAQMLQQSDNVIAECLGRQVALAAGDPATFTGAAAAIRAAVRTLGVDPGAGMRDASGLAAADRLTTATLARLLHLVASRPGGDLGALVAGLPVAGWSGSLADRYLAGSAHAAAGLVRAKTGTLTGVSALAGLVHDRTGRLLAFAFVADRAASTPAAEAALDDLAADLAAVGSV